VRIGRVQALIASAAAIVTEVARERAEIDPEMVERLAVTLDASQVAWSRMAKRWGELTGQDSCPDPVLARAASEVRAAISDGATITSRDVGHPQKCNDVSRHLLTVSRDITGWSQGDSNP
jgi:plasmid maintenance system antidote protein VapI